MKGSKITTKQVNEKIKIVHNFIDRKKNKQTISSQIPIQIFSCAPIHCTINIDKKSRGNSISFKYSKPESKTLYFRNKISQDKNYFPYLKIKKEQQMKDLLQQLKKKQSTHQCKQDLCDTKTFKQINNHDKYYINQAINSSLTKSNKLKSSKRQNNILLNIKTLTPLKKREVSPKNQKQYVQNHSLIHQTSQRITLINQKKAKQLFQIKTEQQQNNQNYQNKVLIKRSNMSTASEFNHQKRKSIPNSQKNIKNVQIKYYNSSYFDFCIFLQLANNYITYGQQTSLNTSFKVFVGKGNNSNLVKSIFKNRYWVNVCENPAQANIYWSQSRDQNYIQSLNQFQGEKKVLKHQTKCIYKFKIKTQSSDQNIRSSLLSIKKNQHIGEEGFHKICSKRQKNQNKNAFKFQFLPEIQIRQIKQVNKLKIHNHLEFNWNLTNKKALYYNLKSYYLAINQNPFQFIPLTYHVQQLNDNEWNHFELKYNEQSLKAQNNKQLNSKKYKNLWIIKPGENSNRGCGIQVSQNIEQIKQIVRTKGVRPNGKKRSHIIQKYLIPYLYNKRKFDIRCYILVTCINGILKCYWYQQGYIRTASKTFTTKNIKNRTIHLTNDAIQKHSQQYGKFQTGNKLSFSDFQKYLNNTTKNKLNFYDTVYPKMMKLTADCIKSTAMILDKNNREFTFQIFGLDFMIDQNFNTYLIQVNTNPCLQLSSPLLARIIPNMLENAFKIAIDPFFNQNVQNNKYKNLGTDYFCTNKFVLIFDSRQQRQKLDRIVIKTNLDGVIESDEQNQIQQIDQ